VATRGRGRRPRAVRGLDHRSLSLATRFWSRVRRAEGDACWEWLGATTDDGYGQFRVGHRIIYAHRFAWIATYGPLLDELLVLHRCDNPICVRPDHFFLGTHSDNNRDRAAKGRHIGERTPPRILCARDHRRLTKVEREQIRKLFASGAYTKRFLGVLYGVDRTTIRHAVEGTEPDRRQSTKASPPATFTQLQAVG